MSKSLSTFIRNQFPKYLVETDSMFPYFMEAYYEWMSQKTNPVGLVYQLDGISDVDERYEDFVDEFISEYIEDIPEEIAADKKLLIKKVSDLYKSKGTNKSIKLLFRILYNIDVSIINPSENLFKPSSAKWIRQSGIRFTLTTGTVPNTRNIKLKLVGTKTINFIADTITPVADNIYEIAFYDALNLDSGNWVVSGDGFTGTLIRTVSKKKILTTGAKFKVGDVFDVFDSTGTGTKIKVTRTDGDKLKSIDIIQFGTGHITDFNFNLNPNVDAKPISPNLIINDGASNIPHSSPDAINKIIDNVQISKFTYLQSTNYLENNNYVGELLRTEQTEVTGNAVELSDDYSAIIAFQLDYIFQYPGYYLTNEGIPSDTTVLQDGEYWQQFSYVLKSEKQLEDYKESVKKLVHPAGLRLFGEYDINSKVDLLVSINTFLGAIYSFLVDSALIGDQIQKNIFKTISYRKSIFADDELSTIDFEAVELVEQIIVQLQKAPIEESQNINDSLVVQFNKNVAETISLAEEVLRTINKVLSDDISTFEVVSKNIEKRIIYTETFDINVDANSFLFAESASTLAVSNTDVLDLGDGSLLAVEEPISLMGRREVDGEEIFLPESGGVILNSYYSSQDMINNNRPYWQFGYTVNERIIQ